MLKYKITFGPHFVEAEDYKAAISCAVALAYSFKHVEITIGHHVVWTYHN